MKCFGRNITSEISDLKVLIGKVRHINQNLFKKQEGKATGEIIRRLL
jgi:hypothetical protein